jgi:hypothetical protein
VGAGRQGASYSLRVSSFDWARFYDDFGGGVLLARTREHLKENYDYILIDSRTGLADTSGICTVQMPDKLVVCFTLNNQSVNGAAEVAESVRQQRGEDFPVLSVPTRIDNSEKLKLDLRRAAALERFSAGLDAPASLAEQWAEVEVGYQPFYAYVEVLATFGDLPVPGRSSTILAAAERMAAWVSDGVVTKARIVSEPRRREVLARYEGTFAITPPDVSGQGVFLSYRRGDAAYAGRLYDALTAQLGPGRVAMDSVLEPGVDFVEHIESTIEAVSVVLVVIGPEWLERQDELSPSKELAEVDTDFSTLEIQTALAAEKRVVPVLVGGAEMRRLSRSGGVAESLARRQAVELDDSRWGHDVRRLTAAVELAMAAAAQPVDAASPAPRQHTTSRESSEVIDSILGRQLLARWGLATGVIVAIASLLFAILTLLKV